VISPWQRDLGMPIICDGCGQPVRIPAGYTRNKIRCDCGVYCAVPESARAQAEETAQQPAGGSRSTPAVEEQAERWLSEDEPPVLGALTQPRSPSEPALGALTQPRSPSEKEPVWWPPVDNVKEEKDEDEEDSSPYAVEGGDEVPCPKCYLRLPPGSVLCVRCGYHLKKRKKIAKNYQPIDRVWETNSSLQKRLLTFGIISTAVFVSGLIGVLHEGIKPGAFVFSYLVITIMTAFLFGTFDRIHLTRDARGRVELTKTWRICFFAAKPQRVDVRSYEAIVSGRHHELTAWDYFVWFFLFGSGIVPGIIWYFAVINRITFHVSLSRDHGFPAYILYSGRDEMQMKEIAYTLRDAARLPYEAS
jgi:hypothetical protein